MRFFSKKKKAELSMDPVWHMDDPNEFVIAMDQYLRSKCSSGHNMSALSEPEQFLYITGDLESAVMCDSLYEYFYESSGNHAGRLVEAFTAIGSPEAAAVCQKALDLFENGIPEDPDERQEFMDEAEPELEQSLKDCEGEFMQIVNDLSFLRVKYCIENRPEIGH